MMNGGTLNYITSTKVKEALALAAPAGVSIGRAWTPSPGPSNPRPCPSTLYADMTPTPHGFCGIAPHGFSVPPDARWGMFTFEGEMYNGRRTSEQVDRSR